MSRLSLFNSPLLLGFDHFERALDRVSKISSDGYPPYNIEQLSENALWITLAVAGFAMSDLGITIAELRQDFPAVLAYAGGVATRAGPRA